MFQESKIEPGSQDSDSRHQNGAHAGTDGKGTPFIVQVNFFDPGKHYASQLSPKSDITNSCDKNL